MSAHVTDRSSLFVVLLHEMLCQSAVLVERLTAADDGAVVGALVCLGVTSEVSGCKEGAATAWLLARVPSVVSVRQQVAVQMVCTVESSRAGCVRADVEASVGVCSEVAIQFAQLVVRFVAAGMSANVRAVGGGNDCWSGGSWLLDDDSGGERQWRRCWCTAYQR